MFYNGHICQISTHCDKRFGNINGRDVQRKNVVNTVDKSSLWAP